jgi:hypothetical protein
MKYINQIDSLTFTEISKDVWETIQLEGLDEEFDGFLKSQWSMAELVISEEDKDGLIKFNKDTVEFFNLFDIHLKENYTNLIDFIDYDKGNIKIIKFTPL